MVEIVLYFPHFQVERHNLHQFFCLCDFYIYMCCIPPCTELLCYKLLLGVANKLSLKWHYSRRETALTEVDKGSNADVGPSCYVVLSVY